MIDGEDTVHLERARALARRGRGRVEPNPRVGCVLVRDGRVVGEGWHREFGGPHAEVEALREAGEDARESTAYVSLEPCDHAGKTPACSRALLEAGVARLVYGAADPGDESGGGARRIREAGVEVVGPVLDAEEGRRDNPSFFHRARTGSPYVTLKLAVSLDGGIAAAPGRRTNLTGDRARAEVHRLRARHQAVLVGSGTVEVDDPLLTVREGAPPRVPPTRVVLDTDARTPPDATLFRDVDEAPVLLFVGLDAPDGAVDGLREAGAEVVRVPPGPDGLSLEPVFEELWSRELRSILCEGGGVLASSLLRAGRIHRIHLFLAPTILGPERVPAFSPPLSSSILEGWRTVECKGPHGPDAEVILDPPPPADGRG